MKPSLSFVHNLMVFFIKQKSINQMLLLLLFSIGIVTMFSFIFGFETSLTVFLDPGNFDPLVGYHLVFEFFLVITGILLSSMIIGIITNGLEHITKEEDLKQHHSKLVAAFKTVNIIRTRNLIQKIGIVSKLRRLNIIDAEIRLEIAKNDIIESLRKFGKLRLRRIQDSDSIYLESFNDNRIYGCYENNNSHLTIIATQNYSDAGIGHFCSTLSDSLHTNYISNEYYSSGSPAEDKQINFAMNDFYANDSFNIQNELLAFINDLDGLMNSTKTVFYIGTCSAQSKYGVHVMFGGERGEEAFDFQNRTVSDHKKIHTFISELRNSLEKHNSVVATHEEFGSTNSKTLAQMIRKKYHIDVVKIYINMSILESTNDDLYYAHIKIIMDSIHNNFAMEPK